MGPHYRGGGGGHHAFICLLVRRLVTETAKWKDAEERLLTTFDNMPIAAVMIDKDDSMYLHNKRFLELFGYTPKDIPHLADWWVKAYPDEQYRQWVIETWNTFLQRSIETGENIEAKEYRVTRKNGEVLDMEISGHFLGDRYLATLIDNTERNRANKELIKAKDAAEEIGIGLAVGLLLTGMASWLLKIAWRRHWLTETWIQVPIVALALACFAAAQWIGGSGFIAAFSGGLLFGVLAKKHREEFLLAAEGTGDTMALITWVIFGAAVVSKAIGNFSWMVVLYAILSLTLIRMLPVFFALTGLRINAEGKLFIGWFGPRGLASIVFAVIVVNANLPNDGVLAMTVVCTVILSIILHGISANPWARGYGERSRRAQGVAHAGD